MPIGRRSNERPPTFCPRCRRAAGPSATLCDHCGETLARQGYCAICEQFWPLSEGEDCPKHDIPLERPDPEAAPRWPDDVPIDWVTVRSYPHPMAADAPRLRLEAEGIPTFLAGERMGANTLYQVATGGVKLQVPRALLADARVLLSQSWAPIDAEDAIDGEDEADDPAAAEPSAEAVPVMEQPGPELPPLAPSGGWLREVAIVIFLIMLAMAFVTLFRGFPM